MTLACTSASFGSSPATLQAILESDAAYFDAGAVLEPVPGGLIARIKGLENLPAACVVHRINPRALPADLDDWVDGVEARLLEHHVRLSRIYLHQAHAPTESVLRARGYRCRAEAAVALVSMPGEPSLSLRTIKSEPDWEEKLAYHAPSNHSPDGYLYEPAEWVEMERIKCDAGYMRACFIEKQGEVVGVVSLAVRAGLLRFKNLMVHPDFRGQGIAVATVQSCARHANRLGLDLAGAFTLAEDSENSFYHKAGCQTIGKITEWKKDLEG